MLRKNTFLRNPTIFSSIFFIFYLLCCVEKSDENNLEIECRNVQTMLFLEIPNEFVSCENLNSSLAVGQPGLKIVEVVHSNGSMVNNLDRIEALDIRNAKMKFLPNGIKDKFPNLKSIWIISSGLTYLDKDNMRQFGSDLVYANFYNNSISVLDTDLFQYNLNIKVIHFNYCPLKFIDPGFFENLKSLKQITYILLKKSGCIDQYLDEKSNIQNFKWNNKDCKDTAARDRNLELLGEVRVMRNHSKVQEMKTRIFNLENKIEISTKEQKGEKHNQKNQSGNPQNFDSSYIFIFILICYLF